MGCSPKGVHTTPWDRYACAMFIDNDLSSSKWGARNTFSSYEGGFAKNN